MTVIDDRQVIAWPSTHRPDAVRPVRASGPRAARTPARRRPGPSRPDVAPMRYGRTGVPMSRAVHGRRSVSTAVTLGLAGLAALITLWLGSLAHFSAGEVAPAKVPDQLAVVQVQAGETLQQIAARVAPDAPVSQVAERIRDLNKLDSAALDAGQTLIAPIG